MGRLSAVKAVDKWADGEIHITSLDSAGTEVHASIKEKRGKRALYYDLTLTMRWTGKSRLGRSKDSYGQMDGILKMYNIGQDTKFELGGDKETSYMYELGFATQCARPPSLSLSPRPTLAVPRLASRVPRGRVGRYHGACEPWATQLKEMAANLFEVVSEMIPAAFVPAIEAKGELVK